MNIGRRVFRIDGAFDGRFIKGGVEIKDFAVRFQRLIAVCV